MDGPVTRVFNTDHFANSDRVNNAPIVATNKFFVGLESLRNDKSSSSNGLIFNVSFWNRTMTDIALN